MDTILRVNAYDANDKPVPGAEVSLKVTRNVKDVFMGPISIQGTKESPGEFQIPSKLDNPVVEATATYNQHKSKIDVDTRQTRNVVLKFEVPIVEDPIVPNPWINGSFYLFSFVVVAFVFLAIANFVPWYFVPAVIIGSLLAVTLIGAFQLRGTQQLHDEPFLKLMGMTFRNLPLIRILARRPKDPPGEG